MIAFAKEWLEKLFGSDAVAAIARTAATRWNAAPYTLGAMSAAVPGGQPARRVLMEPLGNLFLAGEAAHETLWGTVDGAWESGERAAAAALKRLDSTREVEHPEPRLKRGRKPRTRTAAPRGAAN